MFCSTTFNNIPRFLSPIAVAIGNFDGVHLGHLALFQTMNQPAQTPMRTRVVISFLNHPLQVLRPNTTIETICTLEHKIALIEKAGIDALILLDFTAELAAKSAEEFIELIQESIPFHSLILGPDAAIGKNREGDAVKLAQIAQKHGFQTSSLAPYFVNNARVSSSRIRSHITKGELGETEKLLGRPFTIYSRVISGLGKGRVMGSPTANLPVEGLCLPPLGVWIASARVNSEWLPAIANLGHAPTVREDGRKLLEVYLLNQNRDLLDQGMEVRFHAFIRPEQKFPDLFSLKEQIGKDIAEAKTYWTTHSI